ncbi:MAG: hypothetical protein V3R65_09575 [Acidiferrobacterales bacterium]
MGIAGHVGHVEGTADQQENEAQDNPQHGVIVSAIVVPLIFVIGRPRSH